VQIPLQLWALPGTPAPKAIHQALADHYAGCRFVTVATPDTANGISRLEPELVNGTNELRLHVFGNAAEGQVVLAALLDNLGKGASGSTVQNMNIMLGLDEGTGLDG
jgi:N-acetyl-gamma-glutamyl-phosphate reductase